MGLIKRFLNGFFFHYKSMRTIDHQGLCQFATKGLDGQDLSGGGGGGGGGGGQLVKPQDQFSL